MSSGLKHHDGKKIAFVVLVATKKEEMKEEHTVEESHVFTKRAHLGRRKGWQGKNTGWKQGPVTTVKNSQGQWTKEPPHTPKSRWKDVTKVLHEAGLLIKDRMASWRKIHTEKSTREEELWTQTEELRCQHKVDQITRNDLADGLRQLKR